MIIPKIIKTNTLWQTQPHIIKHRSTWYIHDDLSSCIFFLIMSSTRLICEEHSAYSVINFHSKFKNKFSAIKGEIDQQEKLIKNGLKKHERVFSGPVVCLYLLDENIQTCLMRNCSILLWLRLYLLPSIKHSHFDIPAGTSTLRHKRIYKTFGSDWIDIDETYIWRPSSQTQWEFLLEMSAS